MKLRFAALFATLVFSLSCSLQAQTTLVDWRHRWNYMHPTAGALPAGSGATMPHPAGSAPWYAVQATFATSYTGPSFTTSGAGFQAGAGAGPIGYGAVDYTGNPLPPPAEFTGFGTTLTTPASGSRYGAYFRTTFTVPNNGIIYSDPVIRYIFDDGGFVYLDGVLVLRVNMAAGTNDDYLAVAANTTNNESHIRSAQLNLAAGSVTGGNDLVVPAIGGNATVVEQISTLAPGVHTLAVALHQAANTSSDLTMAFQLQAGQANCALSATASNVTRDTAGTPDDSTDDTVSVVVKVVPTGITSASWEISGPAGSAALGQGGAYNADVTISNIPIAEFGGVALSLVLEDSNDPFCSARSTVYPPRVIGTYERGSESAPILTLGSAPVTGWVFDDVARTMTMNNGGGGARSVVASQPLDLSATGAVEFTGTLEITDTSSGNEAADSFVAYLIIDGNTASPINLITPYDTQVVDGVLSDDELALTLGTYVLDFSYEIPAAANSVQIVIEGINDSANETFLVRDILFSAIPGGGKLRPFFDVSSSGNNLVFTWESGGGFLYSLRSETTLSNLPIDWPIYDGRTNIAATPPLNTLTLPRPADPRRFFAIESFAAPAVTVFEDDFESGQGLWTVGSPGSAGTNWELGAPTSGPGAANSPVNCFATNLTGSYTLNAEVWLRSPAIDLTSAGGATLNFYEYKDIDDFGHFANVRVLDAADNSVLDTISTPPSTFMWELISEAIPAVALGKVIKLEFHFTSDDFGSGFAGWYVDDVMVTVP